MNPMNLNDKICRWKEHPEEEAMLYGLFMPEETDLLNTIHQFEILRETSEREEKIRQRQDHTAVFVQAEREAEISFQLKKQFFSRIDGLLAVKTAEA